MAGKFRPILGYLMMHGVAILSLRFNAQGCRRDTGCDWDHLIIRRLLPIL
jgi:hypothetical protein